MKKLIDYTKCDTLYNAFNLRMADDILREPQLRGRIDDILATLTVSLYLPPVMLLVELYNNTINIREFKYMIRCFCLSSEQKVDYSDKMIHALDRSTPKEAILIADYGNIAEKRIVFLQYGIAPFVMAEYANSILDTDYSFYKELIAVVDEIESFTLQEEK